MVTSLLLIAAALVVGSFAWGTLRRERADETERFHRAREITSSWAEPGPRFQTVPPTEPTDWSGDRGREQQAG
jgi:hypothetical protein